MTLGNEHSEAKDFCVYDKYVDERGVEAKAKMYTLDHLKELGTIVVEVTGDKISVTDLQAGSHRYLVGSLYDAGTKFARSGKDLIVFVSSLIRAIQRNCSNHGHCFKKFGPENVVVTESGEAMFKQLPSVFANDSAKKVNYDNACSVIIKLLEGHQIPEDINHLLGLLLKPNKEPLYAIHPSLDRPMHRCNTFLSFYDIVEEIIKNVDEKESILAKLPYLAVWREKVQKNKVLIEVYKHEKSNYSFPPELDNNGEPLSDHQKKVHEGGKFLRFIRNAIAHKVQQRTKLMPSDFEVIINAIFPLLSPKLQEAIFEVVGERRFKVFVKDY